MPSSGGAFQCAARDGERRDFASGGLVTGICNVLGVRLGGFQRTAQGDGGPFNCAEGEGGGQGSQRRGGAATGTTGFAAFWGRGGGAFHCAAGEGGEGCSQCWGVRDDTPGYSGGTAASKTTVEVPAARGRGKENELLEPNGTGRFVGRIADSSGPIPV